MIFTIIFYIGVLIILYLLGGIATYIYCVAKTYQFTKVWDFRINGDQIGIFKCPKWTLYWYQIVRKLNGDQKKYHSNE